ncbi:TonB-dependent hemoglobin/transferrin/lactoferrin family receptor [Microbulbifer thermotolerans]|uniref:TonB-dependent hemoglobin/transferrin/lactoferrin family receptor n=1 Tax=Microbulbifer thermotolerans TaxID=252514 RepID=UPI0026735BFC|nr:TonB-dependent hemoglobin/transferrin/lactoferrin family receptor [Microbulbifer thermotolerans]WKT62004.1 TonB-dependent hemoglobin/transferrin/lactoferrin family receptor [Microbulbifer thermotolerans]
MKRHPLAAALFGLLSAPGLYAEETSSADDDLELVVVSGRAEKPLKDVTGSISVVTGDEIEKLQMNDMNQLFKYEPGVEVTGRTGGAQNILVRGMGADRVLMIKDGMRMNEGYGANGLNDVVGRGMIETDTLKQVEVAKGAASSLYGSDALAGIVVFTTKDASDYLADGEQFGGAIKTGYDGISSQTHVSPTLAFRTGNFEQLLHLTYRDGSEEQNYAETRDPFEIESDSLLYKAKYHLQGEDFLSFSAEQWKQESLGEAADGLLYYFRGLADYGYNIVDEHSISEKETHAYQLRYHSETATPLYDQLNISLYRNKSEQTDEQYGQLDINAPMFGVMELRDMWETGVYTQTTHGFLSNAFKTLNERHTLGYGLDLETTESIREVHEFREALTTGTSTPQITLDETSEKFPKNDVDRAGLFVNDEITLAGGALTVTPGLRYDWYEMDPNGALKSDGTPYATIEESNVSFNLGALYRLSPRLTAFAQYGQGFKVPAYDLAYLEHYLQPTASYIYEVVPADDLSPETSDTVELGLRGHIGNIAFSSALFYSSYDDFLEVQLIDSDTFFNSDGSFSHVYETYQYRNIDSVTIKGIEVAATWYLTPAVELFANASYQRGENDTTGEYLQSISPLSGVLGAAYSGDQISSQLILRWADHMDRVNEGEAETAGYGVVDWTIGYQPTAQLSFHLMANNLLDKEYVPYLNVAGWDEDADLSVNSAAGRTFAASVKYEF